MKILILSTLYPPYNIGGAEKSVGLIARGLALRGHEVVVLTLHEGSADSQSTLDGVRVLRKKLGNLYWPYGGHAPPGTVSKLMFHMLDTLNPRMAAVVRDVVQAERPDIVLSNNISGFSPLAWRPIHQAGIPLLHTPRDFYLMCPKTTMFRGGKPCRSLCAGCRALAMPRRVLSRYVDGVTGISNAILDRHREFGLFPNAVFLAPIVSAIDAPTELPVREARGADAPVRFGYVGRLAPEKGVDLLLDGLEAVDPARWTLALAGRGEAEYMEHLRRRCAALPVRFAGFVPVDEFLREVDVVAVLSIWEEPGPRTVLEALGHGLAVICSTRCGHSELLADGVSGYVVDPEQPAGIAGAIRRAVENPAEGRAFGAAGRAFAVRRTDAAVALEYEKASVDVIDRVRGRR